MITFGLIIEFILGLLIIPFAIKKGHRLAQRFHENGHNTLILFSWIFIAVTGLAIVSFIIFVIPNIFPQYLIFHKIWQRVLLAVVVYVICASLFLSKYGYIFMGIYCGVVGGCVFFIWGGYVPNSPMIMEEIPFFGIAASILGIFLGAVWGAWIKRDADQNGDIANRPTGFDKNYWDTPEGKKAKRDMKAEKKRQKQIQKYNRINHQ